MGDRYKDNTGALPGATHSCTLCRLKAVFLESMVLEHRFLARLLVFDDLFLMGGFWNCCSHTSLRNFYSLWQLPPARMVSSFLYGWFVAVPLIANRHYTSLFSAESLPFHKGVYVQQERNCDARRGMLDALLLTKNYYYYYYFNVKIHYGILIQKLKVYTRIWFLARVNNESVVSRLHSGSFGKEDLSTSR